MQDQFVSANNGDLFSDMGLEFSEDIIRANMPEYLRENQSALVARPAMVSGNPFIFLPL